MLLVAVALLGALPGSAADQRLRASDGFRGDQFGVTLAFDGRTSLVVGAPDTTWGGSDVGDGAVYVFERGPRGRWEQTDHLVFPVCCWGFGGGVAVSGGRLLVGAPKAECTQDEGRPCGRAFYYERRASGSWEQVAELNSDDLSGYDLYGAAVAVAASAVREVMVVGAPSSRRVFIYERDRVSGEISEVAQIIRSNLDFGRSLALTHDLLLVGSASGKAYAFRRNEFGFWLQVREFSMPGGFDAQFGHAVAMDGGLLAIGAPKDSEGGPEAGAVYLFRREPGGDIEPVAKLLPDRQDGRLGSSVALLGDRLVAGAPFDDDKARNAGAVYLFAPDETSAWGEVGKLIPSRAVADQEVGSSAAVAPDVFFAGGPGVREPFGGGDVGAAFVFQPNALAVAGECPGAVLIRAAGLGPFGRAALLAARERGRSELDSHPCAGTSLDLRDPVVVGLLFADENGRGSLRRAFTSEDCEVLLQAVVEDGCATTNVAQVSVRVKIPQTKIEVDQGSFGAAAAVGGDLAVIGPIGDGVAVYGRDPTDPTAWSELALLEPADGARATGPTAISGATVVVGSDRDDWCGGDSCGSAYVYRQDPSDPEAWTEFRLRLADGREGDFFGRATAISGDTVVVGAPFREWSGAAYVFERDPLDPDVWAMTAELRASAAASGQEFGTDLAIDGDLVAVAARNDRDQGAYTGAVYLFERDPQAQGGWRPSARLTASDAEEFHFFSRVAVADDTVVVGASSDDDLGDAAGAVYVFERDPADPDGWVETAKLLASDGGSEDRFGSSIAMTADRILVGTGMHLGVGAAYLFERDPIEPGSWEEILKLSPSDGEVGDDFGETVDLDAENAIVGAPDGRAAYLYLLERLPGGGSDDHSD